MRKHAQILMLYRAVARVHDHDGGCAEQKLQKKRAQTSRLAQAEMDFSHSGGVLQPARQVAPGDIPTLWRRGTDFNAEQMIGLGFRTKSELETFRTDADIETFRAGAAELAANSAQMPTAAMDPAYYMSHHVMKRRFSKKACLRQILRMGKRLQLSRAAPVAAVDPVADPRAEMDSEVESDDELQLV